MGLDARYDESEHTIWLSAVKKVGSLFEFVFSTNASPATVSFTRHDTGEWALEHSESAVDTENPCAEEPIWSGFLVTGPLEALTAAFNDAAVNGVWALQPNDYQVEPGRIQNLNKAYLRSISVGNYDRVRVPPCDQTGTNDNRAIVLNSRCMKGDIRLKEGYNCLITQTDRSNEITVTAAKGAGAGSNGDDLCANSGELPLFDGEAGETKIVPTQYIDTMDTPDSSTLPGCAGAKPGDTYGWESEPTPPSPNCGPLPPVLCQHKNAIYYTWNNKTWVQTNATLSYLFYGPPPVGVPAEEWPASRWETLEEKMPTEIMWVDKFLSGGPACCELISTINGVGGTNVNMIGGAGINILIDNATITVQKKPNAQVNCT
jgi:hypothetical protein